MDTDLTRRRFISGASVLSLAALTGIDTARLFALGKDPIKRIGGSRLKISLNAYSFAQKLGAYNKGKEGGMSLFDLLDFCAKNNFDAVDATGYYFPGYPKELPSDEFINTFKRRAFELGLDISGTGVRNNFTLADKSIRAADVKHIKDWVEVAAKMGAPVLRVFADTQKKGLSWTSPEVSNGATREQVEEWIANDLKECSEHGKKFGIIIGVQNHGDFLKTAEDLLSLVKRVDSEWCGVIVDTGYFKTPDPYVDMAKVAPYAVNWQIKTSPFGQDSDIHTDVKRLIKIIKDSGYRGYIPIETLAPKKGGSYDPFTAVPKFLAEIREAIG
ncbi:MAG: sugar phosphate isomerase/epimerase family protein [Bacteroidota bacterium]